MAGTRGAVCASVADRFSSIKTKSFAWMYEVSDVRFQFQWLWWGQMQIQNPGKKNGFNQTTPPSHPQFEGHFHAICTNPLVSNPGFKKKPPRLPTWNGISAMCQDLKDSRLDILAHWCSWFQQPPNQVPCTWSTGSVATVQWRVPSAAPLLVTLCLWGVLAPGGLGSEGT